MLQLKKMSLPVENIFNVRVYGLLLTIQKEILVAEEKRYNTFIRKFPGGGLQFGEGTIDAVKREFKEELNIEIEIIRHFYTTDFFVPSAFNNLQQVISIFYLIKSLELISENYFKRKPISELKEGDEQFYWKRIDDLREEDFTFPIEKKVCGLLKKEFNF